MSTRVGEGSSPEFSSTPIDAEPGTSDAQDLTTNDVALKAFANTQGPAPSKSDVVAQNITRLQDSSVERVKAAAKFQMVSGGKNDINSVAPEISSSLLMAKGEDKTNAGDHEQVAKAALAKDNVKNNRVSVGEVSVPNLPGEKKMIPYAYDKTTQSMKDGQITPTSLLLGNPDEKDHLMNCYVVQMDKRAIVRTGVIETNQKKDEFKQVLNTIKKELGDQPLRVVSQQLCSHEREAKLINNQHAQMAKLNKELKDEGIGEIVHINIPTNRFYYATKYFGKLPIIGALIEKFYLKSERKSKEQNLEAWPSYIKWVMEDMIDEVVDSKTGTVGDILGYKEKIASNLKNAQALQEEINELNKKNIQIKLFQLKDSKKSLKRSNGDKNLDAVWKSNIQRLQSEIKDINSQLKIKRSELKAELVEIVNVLGPTARGPAGAFSSHPKMVLLIDLLDSQLGTGKPLGRGREELTVQLLNLELGITSAMNCKSGLDRTGFVHAMTLGLEQAKAAGVDTLALVRNWGETTRSLNLKLKNNQEDTVTREEENVVKYRNLVFNNIINLGMPITVNSTGFIGFKWDRGWKENIVPLNFFPQKVTLTGEDQGVVTLYSVDRNGAPTGVTGYGFRLLQQLTALRGS